MLMCTPGMWIKRIKILEAIGDVQVYKCKNVEGTNVPSTFYLRRYNKNHKNNVTQFFFNFLKFIEGTCNCNGYPKIYAYYSHVF